MVRGVLLAGAAQDHETTDEQPKRHHRADAREQGSPTDPHWLPSRPEAITAGRRHAGGERTASRRAILPACSPSLVSLPTSRTDPFFRAAHPSCARGFCFSRRVFGGPELNGRNEQAQRYTALAADIEARWQRRWAEDGTFWSPNPAGPLSPGFERMAGRKPLYVLDMFAYPGGIGLHVGHPLGYLATD